MSYPSMTIYGQLVEQVYSVPSDDGIGPAVTACMIRDHSGGAGGVSGPMFDGLPVIQSFPTVSQPTLVRKRLAAKYGAFTLQTQDRGILKTAVAIVVTYLTTLNTPTSDLAAQALTDAMATSATARVPLAALQASPYAASFMPLVAPSIQNSFALADAVFPLGTLQLGQSVGSVAPLLNQATVYNDIDTNHALGLGGTWGAVSSVSAAGLFCVAYQSVAEQNYVSISTGYGPVQSRYLYNPGDAGANFPGSSTSKTIVLDLVTYLLPFLPSTTFGYINVHCGEA